MIGFRGSMEIIHKINSLETFFLREYPNLLLIFIFIFFFFWPLLVASGILVPQRPGIKPGPGAVEALSPNHWTARESPH